MDRRRDWKTRGELSLGHFAIHRGILSFVSSSSELYRRFPISDPQREVSSFFFICSLASQQLQVCVGVANLTVGESAKPWRSA